MIKKYILPATALLLLLILLIYFKPLRTQQPVTSLKGEGIHTLYAVKITGALPEHETPAQLEQAITQTLEQVDREISTFRSDSVLSLFNRYQGTEPRPITPGMAEIIGTAMKVGRLTNEAINITVGPLVNLWGFGPNKPAERSVPDNQQIARAKAKVGLKHLKLIQNAGGYWLQKDIPDLYVDLSCMGEGYAALLISRMLDGKGINDYLISVGNATFGRGLNPEGKDWRVAIRTPNDKTMALQSESIRLQGHDISTSGSYLNYFEKDGKRYSHIIDSGTGRPIEHNLASASVIAPNPLEANAWDISMMVLGPEKAMQAAKEQGLPVYLISRTGQGFSVQMSEQFRRFLAEDR
jgi:thiamine biosynthesis lipoprotein